MEPDDGLEGNVINPKNPAWHRQGWVAQRVVWVLLLAVVLTGAIGIFGNGLLSIKEYSEGNLTITYPASLRYNNSAQIKISRKEPFRALTLNSDYLEDFEVVDIVPAPDQMTTLNGNTNLIWDEGMDNVHLNLMAIQSGPTLLSVSLDEGEAVHLSQMVYP